MIEDEWFFKPNIVYGKRKRVVVPALKKGYAYRNIISASLKSPEVVVKIPRRLGKSKGLNGIKNHLDYISRNGKLEIETNTGDILKGREEIKELLNNWKSIGIKKESNKREAVNIVLSMPPGTNLIDLKNAVRDFAKEQFKNHSYAFVLHTDTNHPHVHLCVIMKDKKGIRLNPRKNDIQEWRIRFADKLRENGVACSATLRPHRGIYQKPENSTVEQIKRRGGESTILEKRKKEFAYYVRNEEIPPTPNLDKVIKTREKILNNYRELAKSLYDENKLIEYKLLNNFIEEINNKPIISKAKKQFISYQNNNRNNIGQDLDI